MTDYNVKFTDSVNKGSVTVEANSVNTEDTSLALPGLGATSYGLNINENFLHMLENFANPTAPSNPVEGQLWYDTTLGSDQLKIYDGTNWVAAGNIKKALSEPEAAESSSGDLWVNTSTKQLYLYSGAAWILVGPDYSEGAATGARVEVIEGTDNTNYNVLTNYVNDKIVALYASQQFTPKAKLLGFPTGYVVKAGVNLPTEAAFTGAKAKYYGTAEKAELLVNSTATDTIEFDKIVRKDKANDLSQKLRVKIDSGVSIGENDLLQLSVSGSTAIIRQFSPDGNIDVKVNDNGINTTALRVTPQGRIGVNNLAPQEAMDIVGNIKASGKLTINSNINSINTTDGSIVTAGGAGIAKDINIGGQLNFTGDFDVAAGGFDIAAEPSITAGIIVPDVTNARTLGTPSLKYANVYANSFTGGTFTGSFVGNVTGSADTANRLTTPTTFSFDPAGDVVSTDTVIFDGTGGAKTWDLELNDSFVNNKPDAGPILQEDEILINRSGVLFKTNHRDFMSKMYQDIGNNKAYNVIGPTVPIGSIMPYAGTDVAPNGWLFCHGQELQDAIIGDVADYEALAAILNLNYGGSTPGNPRLPDLRGRFPLGNLTGTYTSANRVTDGPIQGVGTNGGEQERQINQDNLPDHSHSLEGDGGTQFYATTTVTGATDTGAGPSTVVGSNPGSQIENTGSMENLIGNPLQTIPPFLTIEFIIYTGVHPS